MGHYRGEMGEASGGEQQELQRYRDAVDRRLDHLHQMLKGPGFGTLNPVFATPSWAEVQIAQHLDAAWHLLELERVRLKDALK